MTKHEQMQPNPEVYVAERMEWMQDAVEAVGAERGADPLTVFAAPTEVRDDAEALPLTLDQEARLREVAGRFGIGGEVDVIETVDYQILEGGKPWKIEAEATMAAHAQTVVFAGSPHRVIGEDEASYVDQKFGQQSTGYSEYDMARVIAQHQPGFEPLASEQTLPYGYDIDNGHALVAEATEQLVHIGNIGGRPVMLLRVDRENYEEEGQPKYRNQPDSAALMRFVGDMLTAEGNDGASVGLATSTTYASRAVDAVRAGLDAGRYFGVSMYGRQTIAAVRQEPVAEPTGINQIPGELHAMYEKLVSLQSEIQ